MRKEKKQFKKPSYLLRMESSKMDRRSFLIKMALSSAAVTLFIHACKKEKNSKPELLKHNPKILSLDEWQLVEAVQDILFPTEQSSPGAREINAAAFLQWVIADKNGDVDERRFIKKGIKWLNEEAVERWEKNFIEMQLHEQEKLLNHIAEHEWGSSWLSAMLGHIFEALLADPVYSNKTGQPGWEWLGYRGGFPQPKQRYDVALAAFKKN